MIVLEFCVKHCICYDNKFISNNLLTELYSALWKNSLVVLILARRMT